MKAAVCYEFGKPLVVEEVDLEPPQKGEVKVRLAATAICHSDIRQIREDNGGRLPFVSGHECAGYVEEVGEEVISVKPGDAAVVSHVASCGKCFFASPDVLIYARQSGYWIRKAVYAIRGGSRWRQ